MANYCINLFWVAEHMFHSCRVSNAVGLLRAWRLALRMSQVGLDDILDILDVHRFCCLWIKNKIIAWISWMSQFVDHNLISQSTYKWMPHLLCGYQLGCAPQVKRLMMIFSHMYTPCTGHTIKLPIFVSYKCSLAALRTAEWTHACYINFGHWGTRLWSRY